MGLTSEVPSRWPIPGFRLVPAEPVEFGSFVDCNLATAWVGDRYRAFPGKYGEDPVWGDADQLRCAEGADAESALRQPPDALLRPVLPPVAAPAQPGLHGAVWFESILSRSDGTGGTTLYALYHNENYPSTLPFDRDTGRGYTDAAWPPGLLGEGSIQAVPRIGVMRSDDGGASWQDRGILLEDTDERLIRSPVNRNFTFPGGVGDPSAVPCGEDVYVFFGEYAYPTGWTAASHDPQLEQRSQCISVARLAQPDLDQPTGRARRWDGSGFGAPFDAPGSPIASLQIPAPDGGGPVSAGDGRFYWGPSVSWNVDLRCWVMLMGRVDAPYWKGDSVFISFNRHADLGEGANSQDWTTPQLLLSRPGHTLWYPSLQPLSEPEDARARYTSQRTGRRARLWLKDLTPDGESYGSQHVIEFEAGPG